MNKFAKKTSFDESVPSTKTGMEADDSQGKPQPKKNAVTDPSSDQYVAVPNNQGQEQQQDPNAQQPSSISPEAVQAAQAFIGPEIMQAAMQGDPNAQDIVAKAAAHFGSTFMNAAQGASAQQPPVDASGAPQPGMSGQAAPVGITSPEEDLAAELVPNVPNPQQAVPGSQQVAQPGQEAQPGQAAGIQPNTEGESPADQAKEQPVDPNAQQQPPTQTQGQDQGTNQMVDVATVVKLINLIKSGKI
jgi:hypothetical protein